MNIPSFDPSPEVELLWDEINEAIQKVLNHGQFILGPEVKELENQVAEYLKVKHAVGVNSGTDALVIGMRAASIESGDEVITTPFSFFATAESISMIGAKPVFIDIDKKTFNLDPYNIEQAITEKTKAILPVHLFGRPAEMDKIIQIAQKHNLKVIEDCAQSFGAVYHTDSDSSTQGKMTGAIGDVGAFSFFPTKNLGGIGDGGMITTNNDEIADIARMLRTHGSRKKYQNEVLGYNSRLDTIQAAVLLVKLKYVDEFNSRRRKIAQKYNDALKNCGKIEVPEFCKEHVFHQYSIRIKDGKRDDVKEQMAAKGISTSIYYPIPQDRLPVYKGQYDRFPNSDQLSDEILSLPIWPHAEVRKVEKISEDLKEVIESLIV